MCYSKMLYSPPVKGNVLTNCSIVNTTGCYNTAIGDKPVGVANVGLELYKKNPLKKGSSTDPIPATPRLSGELTFVVEKLSVELTFD